MVPIGFDEASRVLERPSVLGVEECEPLQVLDGVLRKGGHPVVISCWKLTKWEVEELVRTGKLWLMVYGESMPAVAVQVEKPF